MPNAEPSSPCPNGDHPSLDLSGPAPVCTRCGAVLEAPPPDPELERQVALQALPNALEQLARCARAIGPKDYLHLSVCSAAIASAFRELGAEHRVSAYVEGDSQPGTALDSYELTINGVHFSAIGARRQATEEEIAKRRERDARLAELGRVEARDIDPARVA